MVIHTNGNCHSINLLNKNTHEKIECYFDKNAAMYEQNSIDYNSVNSDLMQKAKQALVNLEQEFHQPLPLISCGSNHLESAKPCALLSEP